MNCEAILEPQQYQFIIEGSNGRNSNRVGIWRQELIQRPWRGAAYNLPYSSEFAHTHMITN